MLLSIFLTTLVGNFGSPTVVNVGPLFSEYYEARLVSGGKYLRKCEHSDHCDEEISDSQTITIQHGLIVMKSEATNKFYGKVMNKKRLNVGTLGSPNGPEFPVSLSWYEAVRFANKLSAQEGLQSCYQIEQENVQLVDLNCVGWRLPTEAEWEFLASQFYVPDDRVQTRKYKVCTGRQISRNREVCDFGTNVYEWVWDRAPSYKEKDPESNNHPLINPTGPRYGSNRVVKDLTHLKQISGGQYVNAFLKEHSYSMEPTDEGAGVRLVRTAVR